MQRVGRQQWYKPSTARPDHRRDVYMGFMYANAYIICVRYVVASVDPPLSYYRSTCTPVHPHPPFSTPTVPDGHRPSVCTYICSSALIYRICIAVNPHRLSPNRCSPKCILRFFFIHFLCINLVSHPRDGWGMMAMLLCKSCRFVSGSKGEYKVGMANLC